MFNISNTSPNDEILKRQESLFEQLSKSDESPPAMPPASTQSKIIAVADELDALIASRLGGSSPATSQTAVPQLTFNPNPKPPETPLMGFQTAANTTALTGIQAVSSVPQVKAFTQKNPSKPSFIWRPKSSAPASVVGSTSTCVPSELSGQAVISARLAPQVTASTQQAAAFMHSQNTHQSISVSSSPSTNMQYSSQSLHPAHNKSGPGLNTINLERQEKESGKNVTQAFEQLINEGRNKEKSNKEESSANSAVNNVQQKSNAKHTLAYSYLKQIQHYFRDIKILKDFMRINHDATMEREVRNSLKSNFGRDEGEHFYTAINLYLESFEEFDYQLNRNRSTRDMYVGFRGMTQNPMYGGEGVFTEANSYIRHVILNSIQRQIDSILKEHSNENRQNLQNFLDSLEGLSLDIATKLKKFLKENCNVSPASPNYDRDEYIIDKMPAFLNQVLDLINEIRNPRTKSISR